MDINQLKSFSKNKLKLICSNVDIKNYKSKNKDKLIEIIINHYKNNVNNENDIVNNENDIVNNESKDIVNNESKDIDKSKINVDIENTDGLTYLKSIQNNSIDLILTDPPYIISKETGMNTLYNNIQENDKNNIQEVKTDEEWEKYKDKNNIKDDSNKNKYLKYGSTYGKKYSVKTDYGNWDKLFTIDIIDQFISEYYKKLRKGGTLIIFFDLWKISYLKEIMDKHKFKQIRFIEWIKTNPQPLNSRTNYLTNSREVALLCVKSGKPTFNSKYDNGIYKYPIQGGKERFHPTQKNLKLIEDLIIKHSNDNDIVLDTFLGSGTTAIACLNTNRQFKGCELDETYYNKIIQRYNIEISK
jgi:site-specific DNA-methyltransferase (adenine-specific)